MAESHPDEVPLHQHRQEIIVSDHIDDAIIGYTKPRLVKGDVCKYFCRGDKCSKCVWLGQYDGKNAAIKGLYSSWITDDILAMARPNTKSLNEGVLENFKRNNIKTVINMQTFGEHASCGLGNENSGFSYNPELFMENGIDHCNYPCEDFGVISVSHLLDIVKIIQNRLTYGKVAVHCHAGLGRTGIAIACYLVFNNRINGESAINYVRQQRPGSIQNTVQVDQILNFAKYLKPLRTIYYIKDEDIHRFSNWEYVMRQRNFIHGHEKKLFHYVPKTLFICLYRISQLGRKRSRSSKSRRNDSLYNSLNSLRDQQTQQMSIKDINFQSWLNKITKYFKTPINKRYIKDHIEYFRNQYENERDFNEIKRKLNTTDEAWEDLRNTDNIHLLCRLVVDWLKDLKFPILRSTDFTMLSRTGTTSIDDIMNLESTVGRTFSLVLLFLSQYKQLDQSDHDYDIIGGIFYQLLTHKSNPINPNRTTPDIPIFFKYKFSVEQFNILEKLRLDFIKHTNNFQ